MTTKVTYKGTSHFRILDAADLKKAGVDGFKKTTFERGVEVEVDDSVAAVLETLVPGEFLVAGDGPKAKAPKATA